MSSSTLPRKKVQSSLPDDIFDYINDAFYDYVKKSYGEDIYGLFYFQSIRSGLHLLQTSSDEILSVFHEESEEINELRQICCFKIGDKAFKTKLGVKLAINSLIELLKTKQNEKKKKKKPLTRPTPSNIDTLQSFSESEIEVQTIPSAATSSSLVADTSSAKLASPLVHNLLTVDDHLKNIEQRINKWWRTISNDETFFLLEGTHYVLDINQSNNETYTCTLCCQCRIRFQLPITSTGFFKLSTYYRHLKEQRCLSASTTVSIYYVELK